MATLSRCILSMILIAWLLFLFVGIHLPPGGRKPVVQSCSLSNLPCLVQTDCGSVVPVLFTSHNECDSNPMVTASTHETALAPILGLVMPDTKHKKSVRINEFFPTFMLYATIPRYNNRGLALSSRLMATRNQYPRHVFWYMYNRTCRYRWYSDFIAQDNVSVWRHDPVINFPLPNRYIGGGRSNTHWLAEELRQYASDDAPIADGDYTMVKYIQSQSVDTQVDPNDIYVVVPLNALAKKLSIRLLVDVCGHHGMSLSRSHSNRARIQAAISFHDCNSCTQWLCVFRPVKTKLARDTEYRESHKTAINAAQVKTPLPSSLFSQDAPSQRQRSQCQDSMWRLSWSQPRPPLRHLSSRTTMTLALKPTILSAATAIALVTDADAATAAVTADGMETETMK